MAARLITNADDFGLTRGINRAVAELHHAGVLTSATLMANGAAFEDAVRVAAENPHLGVGCHVVLTDGVPVSRPETIPTLLGPDRRSFRPSLLTFVRDLLLGRIASHEIEREALAQIQKLQAAGISVTHLDTHKHTHLFPQVVRPLLRAAERCGVTRLRHPFEPAHGSRPRGGTNPKRQLQLRALSLFRPQFLRVAGDALVTQGTFGISATGDLTPETLQSLLAHLPASGTYELLCHPGYNDAELDRVTTRLRHHRELEYQALLALLPLTLAHPDAPQLIHYGQTGRADTVTEPGIAPARAALPPAEIRS